MAKRYEMVYNAEHYTVAANDIIRGKQSMTLQTARLIRLLITQVVKEDKDLKTYTCRISDLANFLNVDSSNLYRDIRQICSCAMFSTVSIGTGNPKEPWEMFHWISTAKYDGNGTLTLRLSDEIKPYVLELEKWFTQYQLKNILEFNSYYAIRLYELLKCKDGESSNSKIELEFEVDELRQYFDCEKKYQKISQFKEKVINTAVREINEKSDLWVNPTYKKTGRAITSVVFETHANYWNIQKQEK
jgi:plasmid replication initiation protein